LVIGFKGSDRIFGRGGNDWLEGREGDDRTHGGPGNDRVFAAPGKDVVSGGLGDDELSNEYLEERYRNPITTEFRGGGGRDYLFLYLVRTTLRNESVSIDLEGSSAIGSQPLHISDVEDLDVGSRSQVEIFGNEADNRFHVEAPDAFLNGRDGDDVLSPSAERAVLDGGSGTDTADFKGHRSVIVDLEAGTITGPERLDGTIANIERVFGSWESDTFRGDANPNYFFGDSGNDTASGGGGDDVLDGWTEADSLDGGEGTDQCLNGEAVTNCESSGSAGGPFRRDFGRKPVRSPQPLAPLAHLWG
ncbi:MAG TPA: hypothetical protein VE975_08565, partial [Actinomycetota bacterium]|nr:hypothetical protein [Actinomycetota bacterium]